MGENMDIAHDVIHWNVIFSRPVHNWEMEVVSQYFELLYSQHIRQGGVDKICWIPVKRQNFEVKSNYQVMVNPAPIIGPWKSIWKSKAPPRVAFFVWTAEVMEWCCMCKHNGESTDHLLLHCEVAMEVWSMVFQLFGVTWVMPGRMKDCLGSWRRQRGNRIVLQIRKMVPLCVMWCMSRERNARSFKD